MSSRKKYTFPSEKEKIGNVAAYMLIKNIPSSIIEKYSKICDEYDFLLCPKTFDSSLFQVNWLFNYSNVLFEKLKDSHIQKKIVGDAIEKVFDNGTYDKNKFKYLFSIYKDFR